MTRVSAILPLIFLAACSDTGGQSPFGGQVFAPDAVDRSTDSVDGLVVGHRLMAAGEYELALKAYLRSAADRGTTVEVLSALGSANLRLGRLGQAERLLRQAVDQDPTHVPALNNLGVVLMETGQVAEASQIFRAAFAADSGQSDDIRANLTLALAKMEQSSYSAPENNDFALVRRGGGSYRIIATDG
ncbi:TPR repeat-containing protein [Palleronia salina]|uniref:TPR repeat-containing protein n=1 Tax=Palleronia salina TaxID=313368 RepID=A0A1M6EWR9_9RHOB|nr:TPR repeat-containing protein [Palleronia salina]